MKKSKGRIRGYLADYRFNSLFFKNLLLILLVILIPLIGALVLGYYAYGSMQKNDIRAYSSRVTADAYSVLERVLKEAKTELQYIGFNSNVELYMYDTAEIRQLNNRLMSIQELIRMPVLAKEYIESIYVYSLRNNKVISLQGISNLDSFSEKASLEEYLRTQGKTGNLMLTVGMENGYPEARLTVFQNVKYGSALNGVTAMNINLELLAREMNLPKQANVFLTDGLTVLFSNDAEMIGKAASDIPQYEGRLINGTVLGRNYSITSQTAEAADLEVIAYLGLQGYQAQLSAVRTFMLVFLLMMVIITLGVSAFISIRIYRPIGAIVASIEQNRSELVGEGELFQEKDELEYILHSIQSTVKTSRNVNEELAERVRLLKKAQAVALQSQINPHFMNNTLDTVNWMAIGLLGGGNEISEMTGALSKMLRMSLENTDSIIPVSMEVRHCTCYLEIQKKRYEDKFDVVWQIPEEVEECRTVRVILQPIVENAIYHGIKHLSNKGLLTIEGRIDGQTVEITVQDNGLGMTPAELAGLRENMQSGMIKESEHIGITNVNQRLKLYFGEEYGVSVESGEGIGTKVILRFPKITETGRVEV